MTAKHTLDCLGFDTSETGANGDAFGFAMGTLSDIAHAIEHYGREYPPAAWGFRDSPICLGLDRHASGETDQARRVAAYIARSAAREREVTHAGDVLDRYIARLTRAGRSY